MKSSSKKYIPAKELSNISAWSPDGLVQEDYCPEDPRIAEILAIFNGQFSGAALSPAHKNSSFIPSEQTQAFDLWNPEEIDWTPPFQTVSWGDWEEVSQPDSTVKARPENTTHNLNLNPEEEMAEMLATARAHAEEIILEAQKSAEEVAQQAEGEIQKSIEEGYRQGRDKAQEEAKSVLQAAHHVVVELTRWREEMLANSESAMLAIIRDIARFMFGDGVKLDELGLQMNLSRILENAKSLGDVRIFINPNDAIRLDPAWKEYQSMLTGNKVIIVPSESIKPGGCFVQGETGSIDARVEAQLEAAMVIFNSESEAEE